MNLLNSHVRITSKAFPSGSISNVNYTDFYLVTYTSSSACKLNVKRMLIHDIR